MLRLLRSGLPAAGLALCLVACGGGGGGSGEESSDPGSPGGGGDDFTFETTEELEVDLQVASRGTPISGAKITITNALPLPGEGQVIEDLITGNVYYQGLTDDDGRIQTTIRVPEKYGDLDVIVIKRGMTGPYAVEEFRELWGPFGPAARVRLGRAALDGAQVELEVKQ
ncbi:MAG: hypothetical protein RL885_11495 [Planctomycetota bacterium]